jgi:glyoxylase I family protein
MIEVEGFHHVSLVVTDLERAKRFYGEVLGLQEVPRAPFDFPGAWYQVGALQLHLIVHPGRTLRGTQEIDSRDGHIALRVKSYRGALERLRSLGIPVKEKPTGRAPWPQLFLTDPDGNVIELNAESLD